MSILNAILGASGPLITDPTWSFFLVLVVILLSPMLLGRLRIPLSLIHI